MMIRTTTAALLSAAVCTFGANAAITQVALDYNFNGIVHANEAGIPDDPNGYRSISDRGLDFSSGVPSHAVLNNYNLVGTAGDLDIVHLGNRNQTSGGIWTFEASPGANPSGDIGVQPNWLPVVDQTGPQTTTLGAPVTLGAGASASFLFQASNGGGTFDVVIGFQGGGSTTATLTAPDWFGPFDGQPNIGAFAGTAGVDTANPDATLTLTEETVDLSGFAGQDVVSISFQNGDHSGGAAYAILGANIDTVPEPGSLALLGLGGLALLRRRR
ncbi:PEP-CTERM sorting domain-containing protein [Phycisphaeraceae bacterium D3-23]